MYDNGEKILLAGDEYNVEGFSGTPGKYDISVSYSNAITVFDVTVDALNVETLVHASKPNKLTYELGEELNLEGINISAHYSNGNTEDISIEAC